jgi:hypothetical protein
MSTLKRIACLVAAGLTLGATSDQSVQLKRVMHEKLTCAQGILEAVVTSNWTALDRQARALQQLTASPAWAVLASPEYVRYTEAFTRTAQNLVDAARDRDLEAAPLAYVSLTLTCVQCHRYVARARVVQ